MRGRERKNHELRKSYSHLNIYCRLECSICLVGNNSFVTITLWDRNYWYLHFKGEETEARRGNLPKVTQIGSGSARTLVPELALFTSLPENAVRHMTDIWPGQNFRKAWKSRFLVEKPEELRFTVRFDVRQVSGSKWGNMARWLGWSYFKISCTHGTEKRRWSGLSILNRSISILQNICNQA